ncbi:MAG: cell division protein SepF, partial [Clostridia bacterium]|nr:cell division protein SepF [Clostridia bacterium]
GEIRPKKTKNRKLTAYDRFMAKRKASPFPYAQKMQTFTPKNLFDARLIVDQIKAGNGVIFNLKNLGEVLSQRLLDFLSGAEYALGFNVKKLDEYKYLATPKGMQIISDFDLNFNS